MYKIINGYENYSVDENGNIRNNKTGRILKTRLMDNGYLDISLSMNGKSKTLLVHRLVASVFVINYNETLQVNHKDGDRQNNNADNLECIKPIQNIHHAKERRGKRGDMTKEKVMKLFKSREWCSVDEYVRELMKY